MVTKRWIVEGRVQGVSFRAATLRKADELGLFGWVQNLANGCVETLAQGEPEPLSTFGNWLKFGPAGAKVESVTEVDAGSNTDFKDFVIRR